MLDASIHLIRLPSITYYSILDNALTGFYNAYFPYRMSKRANSRQPSLCDVMFFASNRKLPHPVFHSDLSFRYICILPVSDKLCNQFRLTKFDTFRHYSNFRSHFVNGAWPPVPILYSRLLPVLQRGVRTLSWTWIKQFQDCVYTPSDSNPLTIV